MKRFSYVDARTVSQAASALKKGDTVVLAGGTDVINLLKTRAIPQAPKVVVNIKNVSGLQGIVSSGSGLRIGALTRLCEIAESRIVRERYLLLRQAALAVATPQIRNMGTLGGNICQLTRCWYFRYPENVFHCLRKGGRNCPAIVAENQFHSVFGAGWVSDPPCQSRCPGKINIPLYLEKIRKGSLEEAARILLETNPIPAVTGRVCPHFCQEDCNRRDLDEPVSIRGIERFIGDYILEHKASLIKPPERETGKRVAIIGSGPAGLSAAYYLRRFGHRITVFDRMEKPGGMLAYAVPAYRLPREIVSRVADSIARMGVEFRLNTQVGKDISFGSIRKEFDSVFVSTGTWIQRSIGIEGEDLTVSGLSFLTGIPQPGYSVRGKRVLVIGGGNVAVDVGITAKRLGAREVTLACLESRDEMPAFRWEIEQALEEKLKLMPSWGPSRVTVESDGTKRIELVRCARVFDDSGNFCPQLDDNVKETIWADEVLMAVGQRPDLSFLEPDLSPLVQRGLITVDRESQQTGIAGIYAGGDVTTGPSSVIEAISSGRRAALAIERFLSKANPDSPAKTVCRGLLSFDPDCFRKLPAITPSVRPVPERTVNGEDVSGFVWNQVYQEASRCFNCGCVSVNPSDLAPALIALGATIRTTKRTIEAENFFATGVMKSTVLDSDEFITEVEIPSLPEGTRQGFLKFRIRKTIDFPVVSVASVLAVSNGEVKEARIAMSGVAPIPLRLSAAEEALIGKPLSEESATAAGEAATAGTIPLSKNKHVVQLIRTLVKRVILESR